MILRPPAPLSTAPRASCVESDQPAADRQRPAPRARRLSDHDVACIRERWAAGECSPTIARDFGVWPSTVRGITSGRTHRDQPMVDMSARVARPRLARGLDHPHAKLRPEDVIRMRALHRFGGVSIVELAREYGVHRKTVHAAVVTRSTWRWVEEPECAA
jgi:hypothetical protein